jgi:protein-L-isoaspartate(D-aspartate) O-methyltransferase
MSIGAKEMSSAMREDFQTQAREMVEQQLRSRGVRDQGVLNAMAHVPRHAFVHKTHRAMAYADRALPNDEGQTISQPYIVARMTEMLAVEPDMTVLEIGTGSGYQTAVLVQLGAKVVTIENHASLADVARRRLGKLGYDKGVTFRVGDGTQGCADLAPFDRILVTAAAPTVPPPYRQQLADLGRIVIPVGDQMQQHLCTITLDGGKWRDHRGEGCVFVPLLGRHGWSP